MTAREGAIAGDPRFFARTGPHTIAVIARAAGGEAPRDDGRRLSGLASLESAGPSEIGYLSSRRYAGGLAATRAGGVLVRPDDASLVPDGCLPILCDDPASSWIAVAALFHPAPPVMPGVHASAVLDASSDVDPSAEIGPMAVIGPRARVGPACRIGAGAVIGDGVLLGAGCRVGALASISHAIVGNHVLIHPGVRIGQEGFGMAMTPAGPRTLPQLGRVIIGDDVEVGANTTIDRGALTDTVIGDGTRIDNLVQIGHNCRIGRGCVIAALAGLSGSTVLEDFVTIGGQAGFAGHLRVGKSARIGAQTGVMSDVPAGAEMVGAPAQPARAFFRQVALLRRLAQERGPGPSRREETD